VAFLELDFVTDNYIKGYSALGLYSVQANQERLHPQVEPGSSAVGYRDLSSLVAEPGASGPRAWRGLKSELRLTFYRKIRTSLAEWT
jgi:hypothetical protein